MLKFHFSWQIFWFIHYFYLFSCLSKITDLKVLDLLQQMQNTEATYQYLKLSCFFLSPTHPRKLQLQIEFFMPSTSFSFLRIWRQWLHDNSFSEKSFLTKNAWHGLEIDFILLIKITMLNKAETCWKIY